MRPSQNWEQRLQLDFDKNAESLQVTKVSRPEVILGSNNRMNGEIDGGRFRAPTVQFCSSASNINLRRKLHQSAGIDPLGEAKLGGKLACGERVITLRPDALIRDVEPISDAIALLNACLDGTFAALCLLLMRR